MKISQAKHFLDQLEVANTKGQYLTETVKGTHQYSVVNKKTDKTLNTESISNLAKDCFEALKADTEISHSERADIMKRLSHQIKNYDKRVHNSKNWINWIGKYLGCISEGEKRLNATRKLAKNEKKISRKAESDFQDIIKKLAEGCDSQIVNDLFKQKKIYMRTFGGISSDKVRDEKFEGTTRSAAIKCYLDDLIEYKKNVKNSVLTSKLDEAIKCLEFAFTISLLQDCKRINKEFKKELMDQVKNKILNELQSLAQGPIGGQMIIPGGYEKILGEGHAVLYQITKTAEGTCSFTIINTGEGAKETSNTVGQIKNFGGELVQELTGVKIHRHNVQDITYSNLKFEQLDKPFFEDLFNFTFTNKSVKPMDFMVDKIDKALGKDKINKPVGREHKSQEIGSCTFKCISSWLKGTIEKDAELKKDKEYEKLKVFITKKDLAELKNLQSKKRGKASLEPWLKEGDNVLKSRQKKTNIEKKGWFG